MIHFGTTTDGEGMDLEKEKGDRIREQHQGKPDSRGTRSRAKKATWGTVQLPLANWTKDIIT